MFSCYENVGDFIYDLKMDLGANSCDGAEEGEITDDNNFEYGVDLSYDTVSSTSLNISSNSFLRHDSPLISDIYFPESATNDVVVLSNTVHKKIKRTKARKSSENSDTRKPRRSKHSSNHVIKTKFKTSDSVDSAKTVLHYTKDANVIPELGSSKVNDKPDVIFISDDDHHHSVNYSSHRRGSTQEKENAGSHRSSRSSEKEREFSRKKFKHKDHYLKSGYDISRSRKKTRSQRDSKHSSNRVHKHLHSDSDSDGFHINVGRHRSQSSSRGSRSFDLHSKDIAPKRITSKPSQKEIQGSISSEDLSRFKDNILMRKLLESGTIKRTRSDSCGSDLQCEIGSVSSVSTPEFELFEDIHINDEDSIETCLNVETHVPKEFSSDSEIEVIIPEKKVPELIDLKSESETEDVKTEENKSSVQKSESSVPEKEVTEKKNCDPSEEVTNVVSSSLNEVGAEVEIEVNEELKETSHHGNDDISNDNTNPSGNQESQNPELQHTEDEDDLQLRLAALRSAVMKKHMERIQKRLQSKSTTALEEKPNENCESISQEEKIRYDERINDELEDKILESPSESVYCPSNRTSPYSPTSSFSLSLRDEDDNNVEEQDMEIAATDEDENYIAEQNIPVPSCPDNEVFNKEENSPISMRHEFNLNFQSDNAVPSIFAMDCHSSETTQESISSAVNHLYSEVAPQPLPPGVELSNLPPEFSHSFFVSNNQVDQVSVSLHSNDPILQGGISPSFSNANDSQGSNRQAHLSNAENPLIKDNCSENLNFDNNQQTISSQDFDGSKLPVISHDLSAAVGEVESKNDSEAIPESKENHTDVNTCDDKLVAKHDNGFVKNLSPTNIHGDLSLNENGDQLNSCLVENNQKEIQVQQKSVLSETLQDPLRGDDDDEDVLREKLLTSLSSRTRSLPDESPLGPTTKKLKTNKLKSKLLSKKKRIVIDQSAKLKSMSDFGGSVSGIPYIYRKKKTFKDNFQINLLDQLNKPPVRKRQVIPTLIKPVQKSISKFIIKVGESSDSAEDQISPTKDNIENNDIWLRRVSIREENNLMPAQSSVSATPELERSVDLLLKQVREKHEIRSKKNNNLAVVRKKSGKATSPKVAVKKSGPLMKNLLASQEKQDSMTPLAVRHLPKSQQEEYRRLKQQIMEKERLRQQQNAHCSISLPSSKLSPEAINNNPNSPLNNSSHINSDIICSNCQKDVTKIAQENDSRKLLENVEKSLVNERYTVLDNLSEMDIMLKRIEFQAERYNSTSKEVARLRELLAAAELRLEKCTKEYIETRKDVGISYKKLLESRLKCSQYAKSCKEVGCQIAGASYVLPKAAEELLKKRNEDIMKRKSKCLTNLVRNNDSVITDKSQSSLNKTLVSSSSKNDDTSPQGTIINQKRIMEESLNTSEHAHKAKRTKESNIKPTDSEIVEKPVEEQSIVSSAVHNPDNVLEYVSPLNHLHSGLSRGSSNNGKSSHDAILCPYDLRGSCMDDSCPYQH